MAPDKIFISSDPFGFMYAYDMENHPPHGEEYIRLDALLEWAKEKANLRWASTTRIICSNRAREAKNYGI